MIPYEITVFTGSKLQAGTDANVFIQMYGLKGKTEKFFLRNKSDAFERNKVELWRQCWTLLVIIDLITERCF